MSRVGTPQWMAPELLREDRYTEKADVFSFGVILWELVTLQKPYEALSPLRVIFVVGQSNARLKIPHDCPPVLRNLIEWCFKDDIDRPSFDQIMEILDDVRTAEDLGVGSHDVIL
jgi:serine/threonine-protein kinase CTR1